MEKSLPIYELLVDEVSSISIVDMPAIETNFFAFKKQFNLTEKFLFTEEDKRIVVGPAIIPNKLLYRNQGGEEFYCYFTQETINEIKEKLLLSNKIKSNINHNNQFYDDVYLTEIWVKEFSEDKSNKYGFSDLPIGTLFVSYKVNNDKIWNKIKNKELRGFSVEGYFGKSKTNKKITKNSMLRQEFKSVYEIFEKQDYSKVDKIMEFLTDDSFDDYPEAAKKLAKKALDLKSEGLDWGTPVGITRANQISKGEPLSLKTLKRTYSYLKRARAYYTGDKEDKGTRSYWGWGGDPMLKYVERKLKELGEINMEFIKVKSKENREEFITRGITDDTMIKEYPDIKQRLAVLYSIWRNKG